MHRSVLQNKGYIRFASENTVEVISMEELDRAVEEEKYLETYTVKDPYGDEVQYLVRFPGLTVEQLRALSNGPALEYMEGGKIPYTAIVDPHTEKQMEGVRGQIAGGDLMDLVKKHRKALDAKYGKGIDRGLWNRIAEGAVQADLKLGDGRIAEAMGLWQHLAALTVRQPEVLQRKVEAVRETVLKTAAARLDALEAEGAGKASVRKELKELARALRDTDLEARAATLASQE